MNFNWVYRLVESLKFAYSTFLLNISNGKISNSEVKELLKKYCFVENIRISDRFFTLCDKSNAEKIFGLSPIKFRKYQAEIYDCDDFSFSFMGLYRWVIPNFAVGIIWTKTHAYNFFIDSDKKLWGIEPQSNKIFEVTDKKENVQLMLI